MMSRDDLPPRRRRVSTTNASSGRRTLKQRVKTARGRKTSSTAWLRRQLNDPYVAEAKIRGLRSRAAFKLEQINNQFGLIKSASRVLDLGAAPGGWTQVVLERLGQEGRIVAVDMAEMEEITGALVLRLDFMAEEARTSICKAIGQCDLVLSDMAAPATGHTQTDHLRIVALCESAHNFACEILTPGGAFVAKVLRGGTESGLLSRMKKNFESVQHYKPDASRRDSAEIYVIAKGFRAAEALRQQDLTT